MITYHITASADYMGSEMIGLNASVFRTLKQVFPDTVIIPGSYNYYFGTNRKGLLTDDPNELVRRWNGMNIRTKYFGSSSIPHIASTFNLLYVKDKIAANSSAPLNTDLKPVSYLYTILIWLSYFPGMIGASLQQVLGLRLGVLIVLFFAAAVIYRLAASRSRSLDVAAIPVMIGITGASAMTTQLLLIYSFEAVYGYVYLWLGVLIAVFMGGLTLGGYLSNFRYRYLSLDAIITALLCMTGAFAVYLASSQMLGYYASEFFIPFFSLIFAVAFGALFPAAVRKFKARGLEKKAGILYGSDLFGGAASAFLTSLLFIPVFGIMGALGLTACMLACSLILCYCSS